MINISDSTTGNTPVVTFSNIPLDDEPVVIGFDSIPAEPPVIRSSVTPAVVSEPELEPEPEPTEISVIGIQFKKGGKIYYFDPCGTEVPVGADVIIDTARGAEYGFCAESNHEVPVEKVVQPLRPLIRIATETDKRTRAEFKSKEAAAFDLCQEKILDRQLDMKLVSAEYSFDGSKILFYFTSDGRVDFRELVKDLAGIFRTRIELRQIGVRDEAKMMGGLGICGRPFCCKQFLDDFQPVSIKMAKTQNLSLNPTKISGTCGRLMCCLKFEQDAYEDLIRRCPRQESIVNTVDGKGTVTEVSLLKETVKVRLDKDPSTINCYRNCDICVLRNGKGKKTDPPIPDDLPPLPKPTTQPEEEADSYTASRSSSRSAYSGASTFSGLTSSSPQASDSASVSSRPDPSRSSSRNSYQERRKRTDTERSERVQHKQATEVEAEAAEAPAQEVTEPQDRQNSQPRRRSQRSGRRSDSRKLRQAGSADGEAAGQSRPERVKTGAEKTEKTEKTEKAEASAAAGNESGSAKSGRSRNGHRRYYRGKKSSGGSKPEQG